MTTTPERTATLTSLVAAEIRAQMGRLEVRQSELARRMGETDQWMSMRLKGRTPIDLNDLNRIAWALGIGVHDLLPPPELAATAVVTPNRVTERYRSLADRVAASSASAIGTIRDAVNRPPGRRDPSGPGRTVRIPRPPLTMFG